MKDQTKKGILLAGLGAALIFSAFGIPRLVSVKYDIEVPKAEATVETPLAAPEPAPILHEETPAAVKAIYMSACAASTPSFRAAFLDLLDETELNSIVIDIKDFTGTISFPTTNPKLAEGVSGPGCTVDDMGGFVETLHQHGVYVIGRITVFQDPHYSLLHPDRAVQRENGTVWKDRKGLSFVDVGSKPYWEYIVELSKESYGIGFDELNFDYIRFPSDGDMSDIAFTQSIALGKTKSQALEEFFAYLDRALLETGVKTSADLFGMVTAAENDMGIGQVLEKALPHFDYIAPMVYPSHYPAHWEGWADPNDHPYEIVKSAMDSAVRRQGMLREEVASSTPDAPFLGRLEPDQFRPWLQDNDYPVHYTPEMVRAQMQAAYDAGLTGWMLWDAGNTYTRAALLEE